MACKSSERSQNNIKNYGRAIFRPCWHLWISKMNKSSPNFSKELVLLIIQWSRRVRSQWWNLKFRERSNAVLNISQVKYILITGTAKKMVRRRVLPSKQCVRYCTCTIPRKIWLYCINTLNARLNLVRYCTTAGTSTSTEQTILHFMVQWHHRCERKLADCHFVGNFSHSNISITCRTKPQASKLLEVSCKSTLSRSHTSVYACVGPCTCLCACIFQSRTNETRAMIFHDHSTHRTGRSSSNFSRSPYKIWEKLWEPRSRKRTYIKFTSIASSLHQPDRKENERLLYLCQWSFQLVYGRIAGCTCYLLKSFKVIWSCRSMGKRKSR